ncbi:MAG: molybdopterin-guanine dinucleotide biosynthesis protein B [Alphaproteobacteria bacterium]|nr:molybdopterin-guanine dinucleotide biosynthesis protein B [Alphaproteobacteria bacterium]
MPFNDGADNDGIGNHAPKVIGFAGFSGAGKTSLVEQLITHFTKKNIKIALIKHAHHSFDIDHQGKDSYRHRKAGAHEVLISSKKRYAHMVETDKELTLDELLPKINDADMVFVEGYKLATIPKIEIYRSAHIESLSDKYSSKKHLLAKNDKNIIAIATPQQDKPLVSGLATWLDLDDVMMVADFIGNYLKVDC